MTQDKQLARVRTRIEEVVIEFFETLVDDGFRDFRMADLLDFVLKRGVTVAPDSPGRVMRQLRREEVLDYWIVRRSDSLYRIVHVMGRE